MHDTSQDIPFCFQNQPDDIILLIIHFARSVEHNILFSVLQEGDFKCDQCDKLFLLQNSLDRHRSIEHAEGDVFQCAECEHSFSQKAELIEHMRTHPLNKPFSCKQCNKDFTRKYHLDRHVAQTGCDGTPRHEFRCQVGFFRL